MSSANSGSRSRSQNRDQCTPRAFGEAVVWNGSVTISKPRRRRLARCHDRGRMLSDRCRGCADIDASSIVRCNSPAVGRAGGSGLAIAQISVDGFRWQNLATRLIWSPGTPLTRSNFSDSTSPLLRKIGQTVDALFDEILVLPPSEDVHIMRRANKKPDVCARRMRTYGRMRRGASGAGR